MTDAKEGAVGLETAESGMDAEMTKEASHDIVEVMRAALEAAVGEASKPTYALAGLLLAVRSLRTALPSETTVTEEDMARTQDFVRTVYVGEAKESCVALARTIIRQSCARTMVSEKDLRAVVQEAADCVDGLQRSGTIEHPVTMLVVLSAARSMAFALLKHQYPDDYEHLCSVARAMEHAIRPKVVGVVEIPNDMRFTKGGSA